MRVNPGLLEKQQRQQQQSCVDASEDKVQLQKRKKDPSRGQNLDFYSWMTEGEKTLFETLIFKQVYFDTVMKVEREEVGKYQDTTHPVLRMGSVQNPKINWKENSRVRIDRSAFTLEASKPGR